MDAAILASLIVGFLVGVAADIIRHRLGILSAVAAEQRASTRNQCEKGYWPTLSAIDLMIEAYPEHAKERRQLQDVFRTNGYLLDASDAEHVWVALSEHADINVLAEARAALAVSTEQRCR